MSTDPTSSIISIPTRLVQRIWTVVSILAVLGGGLWRLHTQQIESAKKHALEDDHLRARIHRLERWKCAMGNHNKTEEVDWQRVCRDEAEDEAKWTPTNSH